MNSVVAFMKGHVSGADPKMVFDWDLAARLILEHRVSSAAAGLREDWRYTRVPILRDGAPVPEGGIGVHLASTWATPEVDLDGLKVACFRLENQTPGWDAHTYWPASARAILASRTDEGGG